MKVIRRTDALDAILAKYNVDLYDYTEGLNVATPAMVCVEIMFEILTAQAKGDHESLALVRRMGAWGDSESLIMSSAADISHQAQTIRLLSRLLDLGMAPYLPRKGDAS